MTRGLIVAVTAATLSAAVVPAPARAGGGDVAAGIVGGLAIGTILGAAAAQPRPYYYGPPPVYVEEAAPVYAAPPRCYWTRGEPVWDPYRGMWRRPRMQVCD
jgi:hypothetical protein